MVQSSSMKPTNRAFGQPSIPPHALETAGKQVASTSRCEEGLALEAGLRAMVPGIVGRPGDVVRHECDHCGHRRHLEVGRFSAIPAPRFLPRRATTGLQSFRPASPTGAELGDSVGHRSKGEMVNGSLDRTLCSRPRRPWLRRRIDRPGRRGCLGSSAACALLHARGLEVRAFRH